MFLPYLHRLMAATLLSLVVTTSVHAKGAPPRVLVTIKPLQLIAAAITDNVSKPELLLPPGSSPHGYSLRPSDVRKLAAADLVFWIGPDMESFLPKVLERHVGAGKAISLMNSQGVRLSELLSTEHEPEEKHGDHGSEHGHDHGHNHGHAHKHGTYDPHIWLDPNNVIAMAQVMTKKLGALDSRNRAKYESNYKKFVAQIKVTDRNNQELLKNLGDQEFFVFHDAWGYLTRHYNLSVADVFTINPTQAPGARHMASLRRQFKEQGYQSCVFREPQFQPGYLDVLINDLQIKVDVLDPLGADITLAPDGYSRYLNGIATTIHRCLSSAKKIVGQPTGIFDTKS